MFFVCLFVRKGWKVARLSVVIEPKREKDERKEAFFDYCVRQISFVRFG